MLSASLSKLCDYISAEGSCINGIEVIHLRFKKTETLMVLTRNNYILHPRILCELYPLLGIKKYGVKYLCELYIFILGYLFIWLIILLTTRSHIKRLNKKLQK